MKKYFHLKSKALTLMELLVVLAIIGIIVMMALPNFMGVVGEARSIEAQDQLKHLYMLEKQYFYKKAKYSTDFKDVRFEHQKLITNDGNAYYEIEIVEASTSGFKARARAVVDFDGDGQFNEWTIDQDQKMIEVVQD